MSKIDLNNMDGMYFDILSEIGNIGAGNATTALAQMIGSKVDMKVPKVELLEFSQVGEAMGGEEQLMIHGVRVMVIFGEYFRTVKHIERMEFLDKIQ